MIIIVAEQLVFLEALLETSSRNRRFARRQLALGQPKEFGDAPALLDIPRSANSLPAASIERDHLFEHIIKRFTAAFGDVIPAKREFAQPPLFHAFGVIVLLWRQDRNVTRHVLDPLDLCILEEALPASAEQIGVVQLEHEQAGGMKIPFGAAQEREAEVVIVPAVGVVPTTRTALSARIPSLIEKPIFRRRIWNLRSSRPNQLDPQRSSTPPCG